MRAVSIFLCLIFVVCSCVKVRPALEKKEAAIIKLKPLDCLEVSRIAYTVTRELQDIGDYHLCRAYLCNGEPTFMDQRILIEFYSQDLLELEDGRDLIVKIGESLLGKANSNPFLRTISDTGLFSPEHFHVIVELESYYGKYVDPLYLGRIELREGIVYYYAHTALDIETIVFQRHIEPYETARMITQVKQEVASMYPTKGPNLPSKGLLGPEQLFQQIELTPASVTPTTTELQTVPVTQPVIQTVPVTQPVIQTVPVPQQPVTVPVPQQPVTVPVPQQPVIQTVPVPQQPVTVPVPQQPVLQTVPVPQQPVTVPVPQQPVLQTVPVPQQPVIQTVPVPPQAVRTTTLQTEPCKPLKREIETVQHSEVVPTINQVIVPSPP